MIFCINLIFSRVAKIHKIVKKKLFNIEKYFSIFLLIQKAGQNNEASNKNILQNILDWID